MPRHQRTTRRDGPRRCGAYLVEERGLRRDGSHGAAHNNKSTADENATKTPKYRRHGPAPRFGRWQRPARGPVAELVMAAAEGRRFPERGRSSDLRGAHHDGAREARRATARAVAGVGPQPAAAGWAAVAAEIRADRRCKGAPRRHALPATRRCAYGGPAGSTGGRHSAVQARRAVRFARGGAGLMSSSVAGAISSSAHARHPRPGDPSRRAEGCRVGGQPPHRRAGCPWLGAATARYSGAGWQGWNSLAIPGTVGGAVWANAGAHGSDVAAVLESAAYLRGDGTEADGRPRRSAGLNRDSAKHPAGRGAPFRADAASAAGLSAPAEIVWRVLVGLARQIRWRSRFVSTRSAAAPEHQPLNLPSAGSIFRNPPGDSAGRLIDAARLKGARVGGAAISERTPTSSSTTGGHRRRRRRLGRSPGGSRRKVRSRAGIRGSVHGGLVRLAAGGEMSGDMTDRSRAHRSSKEGQGSRSAARRTLGRARRFGRLRWAIADALG